MVVVVLAAQLGQGEEEAVGSGLGPSSLSISPLALWHYASGVRVGASLPAHTRE